MSFRLFGRSCTSCSLEDDVRRLLKVVIDGNGTPSLQVRVTRVEDALASQTAVLRWILGIVSGLAVVVFGALLTWAAKRLLGV